jgi:hypothetical protein
MRTSASSRHSSTRSSFPATHSPASRPACSMERRAATAAPLIGNVVWLGPSDDLESTTEGKPLTYVSEALTVTVHLPAGLEYVQCLPSPDSKQ